MNRCKAGKVDYIGEFCVCASIYEFGFIEKEAVHYQDSFEL